MLKDLVVKEPIMIGLSLSESDLLKRRGHYLDLIELISFLY